MLARLRQRLLRRVLVVHQQLGLLLLVRSEARLRLRNVVRQFEGLLAHAVPRVVNLGDQLVNLLVRSLLAGLQPLVRVLERPVALQDVLQLGVLLLVLTLHLLEELLKFAELAHLLLDESEVLLELLLPQFLFLDLSLFLFDFLQTRSQYGGVTDCSLSAQRWTTLPTALATEEGWTDLRFSRPSRDFPP